MAFKSGWKYRVPISINNFGEDPALSDHFHINAPWFLDHFWENCDSTGEDVVFTDSDGVTLLDFEREAGFDVSTRYGIFYVDCLAITYELVVNGVFGTKIIWMYYGVEGTPVDMSTTLTPSSQSMMALFGKFSSGAGLQRFTAYNQRPTSEIVSQQVISVGQLQPILIDYSDFLAPGEGAGGAYEELSEFVYDGTTGAGLLCDGSVLAVTALGTGDTEIRLATVSPSGSAQIKSTFFTVFEPTIEY